MRIVDTVPACANTNIGTKCNINVAISSAVSLLERPKPPTVRYSVGDPDADVFGPPRSGSGSVSQRYGSGSFPFLKKVLERTEIMLVK